MGRERKTDNPGVGLCGLAKTLGRYPISEQTLRVTAITSFSSCGFHLLPRIFAILVIGLSLGTPTIADDLDLDAVRSMIENGETTSALELLDQEIASSTSDSAALRFLRARILVTMGDLEKAERIYRELITRYPAQPEPYNNLAYIYSAQGKLDQAASLLRAGLYTDPAYRALFDNLTRIYAEQAARSLSAALDPEDAESRKALPLGTLNEIPTLLD